MRIAGRFDPRSAADVAAAFEATIRFYERLVRERPAQWLIFDDMWPADRADPDAVIEVLPQRRRSARR
jgi:lauroyl/myristoyl acyltransferase